MSSIKRKIRRNQEKHAKKIVEKQLRTVQEQVDSMPVDCLNCGATFDKHDKAMITTWTISVGPSNAFLICPACNRKPPHRMEV